MLPITASEAGAGLVPPAVASHFLGDAGCTLVLVMLFMSVSALGSTESIAVSSLIAYDVYRQYINPEATGADILLVSRIVIVVFGLVMGAFAILLQVIGINLGWVYVFMGIIIGPAVCPLWNMMTWTKASGTGAVIAAWGGLILALIGWLVGAVIQSGSISVATLGTSEVMLAGNLIAIISSGVIHYVYSKFIDPQDYNFTELDKSIQRVENDTHGLTDAEKDPVMLKHAERWITRRAYILTLILVLIWPLLSIPAGVFSQSYFAFWVLVALVWVFGAAIIMFVLPLSESWEDIKMVLSGMFHAFICRQAPPATDPAVFEDEEAKEVIENEASAPEQAA
jgi:Na+/proline symporter